MEQEIRVNQDDNQVILINSNIPQSIIVNNINNDNIEVNQIENQELNIEQNKNQNIYVSESGVYDVSDVLVNGVSVVSNGIAYVIVPTKTSELVNDSGYITNESDPTVPSYIKNISQAQISSWNNKQNLLVSGTNIKTINNASILGSGNITINDINYQAGNGIDITGNVISNTITSYDDLTDTPNIPTLTSDLINDSNYVSSSQLSEVAFTGSYASLSNIPVIPEYTSDLTNDSGFITKDVNDLTNYTLSSSLSTVATTGNYNDLSNLPTIPVVNDATLTIQKNGTAIDTFTANASTSKTINITVPTQTSELTNNSNFAVTNANNNFTSSQSITGDITVSGEINNIYVDMFNDTTGSDWQTFIKNKIDYAITNLNTTKTNTTSFIGGGWAGNNWGIGIYCKTGGNHQVIWFSSNHVYYCRKNGNNYYPAQLI